MGRPKQLKDAVRVSVVISKKQAEQIKRRAIQMSNQEQRQIGMSEAIRAAIELVYPVKNQGELF